MAIERRRLDELVVERGLAPSRNVARGLVMAGLVLVEGRVVDKAGSAIAVHAEITLKARPRFVSRAGDKLAGALEAFSVNVTGMRALDVGASTGGFVDCLLQNGADQVIGLDVGKGQLDSRLRENPRVTVIDGVNARLLTPEQLPFEPGLLTMDVSFISVTKVMGAVAECMSPQFDGVILIKPQFEAGPKLVGKKGIVRDPEVHAQVLRECTRFMVDGLSLDVQNVCRSPITGVGGNVEFFVHVTRGREKGVGLDRLGELIDECVCAGGDAQGGD